MTALRAAITAAAATLAEAGIDCARTDAELLAAYAAGTERSRLTLLDAPDAGFYERFGDAVAVRARRVPLQHITGTAPFGPLRLMVGPGVFIPRPETESLLEWALTQTLPAEPVIVDLCTGSGALALALAAARPGARVIAVDDDDTALDYARRNAEANGLVNHRALCGDVGKIMREHREELPRPDVVIVDPPRGGLSGRAVRRVLEVAAPTLVYVSCQPATFADNAARFIEGGYRLDWVQPVDMFPNTPHVEAVARFTMEAGA